MSSDARRIVRSVLTAAGPLACAACLLVGSAEAQQPVRVSAATGAELDARRTTSAAAPSEVSARRASAVFRRPAARLSRESAPRSVLEGVFLSLASRRSSPSTVADLGSLGDVLPDQLCRDLLRLRTQVRDARRVLFGQRGIVRLGKLEAEGEEARMRMNLQYSPDPGIRFTLVTP